MDRLLSHRALLGLDGVELALDLRAQRDRPAVLLEKAPGELQSALRIAPFGYAEGEAQPLEVVVPTDGVAPTLSDSRDSSLVLLAVAASAR